MDAIVEVDETESEFSEPLLEPWECTFKFVVLDNKREVISKIWDGYGYPRAIREKVDFTNKVVKFTNKYGKTYIFDKDTYFAEKGDMLTHEMYVLKQMLDEREDMLLTITKRICAACSPHEGVYQNASDYTTSETYVNPNGEKTKYMYSVNRQNAKYISEWGNAVAKKTKNYFAQFETKKN